MKIQNKLLILLSISLCYMSCSKEFENVKETNIIDPTVVINDFSINGTVSYSTGGLIDTALIYVLQDGEEIEQIVAVNGEYDIELSPDTEGALVIKATASGFSPGYYLLELDGSETYTANLSLHELTSREIPVNNFICICDSYTKLEIDNSIFVDPVDHYVLEYSWIDLVREPDGLVMNTDALNIQGDAEDVDFRNILYVNVTDGFGAVIELLDNLSDELRVISDAENPRLWFYDESTGNWQEIVIDISGPSQFQVNCNYNIGRAQIFNAASYGYYAISTTCGNDLVAPDFECKDNYELSMDTADTRGVSGSCLLNSVSDDCDSYPMVLVRKSGNFICDTDNSNFDYGIRICKDEVGFIIPVELMIFDDAGNFTTCESEVWVTE